MSSQDDAVSSGDGLMPVEDGRLQPAGIGRIRFPVRIKLLLAVFTLLTITVALITASMAREFGDDKIAYVNDLAAVVAGSTAAESATVLRGYLHDMDVLSTIASDPAAESNSKATLIARLFARLPEFVSVVIADHSIAVTTIYDRKALGSLGIASEDLETRVLASLATIPPADADTLHISTVAMPGAPPLLVLARALPPLDSQSSRMLLACVRLKELAAAVERSRGFRSALVDSDGKVLVASGRISGSNAATAVPAWIQPMFQLAVPAHAGVVTREFTADGTGYIGARVGVSIAGVIAITAIPRSVAYLTARGLLDNLTLISVALIIGGAVVALWVSRRLTKPIERLAFAAERIGHGKFDTKISVDSSDEIGALAIAFNSMASGLQQRERALVRTQRALLHSEKMSALGQLSAGIAHEVKNPLAGILGHAQLAMRRLGPENPAKVSLDLIAQETRRCNDIINSLLRFARQDEPQFLPVDVDEMVDAALSIVEHQLSLQGIRIARERGQKLPKVEGDFNQLQQVLVNLAINAQQALAGQHGELAVRTRASGGWVFIEVQDSGPGIPHKFQAKIFEPFFTTKAAGQGTGLGLSVSYGIIESHGGRIEVSSSSGQGATFVISMPAAARAGVSEHPCDIPEEMQA